MRHHPALRWLGLVPVLYVTIFVALPLAAVLRYSLLERDFTGQVGARGSWQGWREALEPPALQALGRSAALAAASTLGCALLGYPAALALAALSAPRRRVLVALLCFPLLTSLLLRIYGWKVLLPWEWRGVAAVALVMTVNSLPLMVLPLLRARERLDVNLLLAALDLGATPWQAFWRVTWPLTRPALGAGCLLVFVPNVGEYMAATLIGEGRVNVLGGEIVRAFDQRNWPLAAASGCWLLALVLPPLLWPRPARPQ